MQIRFQRVDWEYASVFRIAYQIFTHSQTVVVELEDDAGRIGRGEALGVSYHGETVDTIIDQLANAEQRLNEGLTRADLQQALPAGGARNALDCALWDLESKRLAKRAWQLAGIEQVRPLITTYTLGLDTVEATARSAAAAKHLSMLKLKLNGDADLERVSAVRQARPDAEIVVDANQAWNERQLRDLAPRLAELNVKLIEQPLPIGKDDALAGFVSPVPLCADESFQTSASLPDVLGKYQYVNIKLDKTGGLTEGLRAASLARQNGLKLMVGCMGGSSLSMAPAFIVGQVCEVVDLDAPLLKKSDVLHAIRYDGSLMSAPEAELWG